MGLPANTTTGPSSAPNAADPMSRPIPSSATDLPPEALALAAKLFDLARAGDTAALIPYLSAGLPPNLTNHSGDTLLMLAAYHGHTDTVQALIGKGADVNAVNGRGQSPLAGAVFKGHEGVVGALVEAGADAEKGQPNAKDTAVMFKKEEWFGLLGVEEGRTVPGMVPTARPGGA
ncbi:ankyrin [Saccharata proteae CBS 121410]|uniref:Ankyrin n=1 Tax=Saccharata proteae CBS 121410 TaxID=1314787 RepID=A0A9P4HZC7_9PEZI|nr:ankyrin [Saccharata proteae CBS 121410]